MSAEKKQKTHEVVDNATWTTARKALLVKEKELIKLKDEVAAARRKLPWEKVSEDYVFDGPDGPVKLSELFVNKELKDLVVYHFMYPEEWGNACKSCSFWVDGFNGQVPHIQRKTNFAVVSFAEQDKLKKLVATKKWSIPMYSSHNNNFNKDYHVGFTKEQTEQHVEEYNYGKKVYVTQMPGLSVFRKEDDGTLYHTYSSFARGLELYNCVWQILDSLPDGRQEKKAMDWLRHKEEYDKE